MRTRNGEGEEGEDNDEAEEDKHKNEDNTIMCRRDITII